MQTKVEGILLAKRPFGYNHLMGQLCLRNGKKISLAFYGGRGRAPGVGHLLALEVALKKVKGPARAYTVKEWSSLWQYQNIACSYRAFEFLGLFLELAAYACLEEDLWDHEGPLRGQGAGEGVFRVLSHGIFRLERASGPRSLEALGADFLVNLLKEQGLFPQTYQQDFLSLGPLFRYFCFQNGVPQERFQCSKLLFDKDHLKVPTMPPCPFSA